MRAKLIALLLVVVPAWLMVPLTDRIHEQRRELKYGGAFVNRKLRLDLGQGLAIGLLAGFRGVVADFVWIQSHGFWEKREWLRQYRDMKVVVTLQPQSTLFWDTGAWHMAWNIGYAASVETNVYTQAQAIQRQREWWERAESFLKEGIENVPNRYDLYFSLAWLYDQKFKDYCLAADYFGKAMSFPDAPAYIARVHARAQEKCGDIRGAYAYWLDLWTQDHTKVDQNWSIVERELKRLEDKLNMPNDARVFPKTNAPPASAHP
jgi:hypothetical protein